MSTQKISYLMWVWEGRGNMWMEGGSEMTRVVEMKVGGLQVEDEDAGWIMKGGQ